MRSTGERVARRRLRLQVLIETDLDGIRPGVLEVHFS